MNSKLAQNKKSSEVLCAAMEELKFFQDLIMDCPTKYHGNLLAKIVGCDTIPFFLITKKGDLLSEINIKEQYTTNYFRVESIDCDMCLITISLLKPLDIEGKYTDSICDVFRLEKSTVCKVIDLSQIGAIQLLDIGLLKRNIIIEPKW
ncbi:CotY/CotZ family spore coat protein [Bacillus sp. FJAT-22090]|uniref:CotY/CotZ family spore coat protein n=1 Tax=Bacillus sp. FJAT-22090 TaxID=1581038 RepID=UPI0011A7DCEE|nr:CotY/CotZ family spore coat protein [Bacillus sp. FJAT-22090]